MNGPGITLIKTDAEGNRLWAKTIGGDGNSGPCSLKPVSDGGFIIVGSTESNDPSGKDILLIKTDANGNVN